MSPAGWCTTTRKALAQLSPSSSGCGASIGQYDHSPTVLTSAWCVGCCWALMASLFALGIMSIAWMAFVAAIIAAEKTLPWRRVATYGTAGILLALGLLLLAAPDAVPALTIPGAGPMPAMQQMGS